MRLSWTGGFCYDNPNPSSSSFRPELVGSVEPGKSSALLANRSELKEHIVPHLYDIQVWYTSKGICRTSEPEARHIVVQTFAQDHYMKIFSRSRCVHMVLAQQLAPGGDSAEKDLYEFAY